MRSKIPWRILCAVTLLAASAVTALLLASREHHSSLFFWITAGVLAGSLLWLYVETLIIRRNLLRYFTRVDALRNETLQSIPAQMPVPIAILNEKQEIIWYNESFRRSISGEEELLGQKLQRAVPLRPDVLNEDKPVEIDLCGRHYRVTRSDYKTDEDEAQLLCFQDISRYVNLRQQFLETRACVLLIVIDNYEDLFNGTRQSERASVLAALEILFDRFLESADCIFCHLDEDRFLVILDAKHCLEMERAHFPLLDEARKITVHESSTLTLSIGVGRSGENLAQNERFAQQSLDMALGRGGDQAAIKTENGFTFYGGVSKGIEHKNKAKNRSVARDLLKLMKRCNHVYIMGHRASDLDSVGAAVGVAFIAEQTDISCNIVIRQESTLAKLLVERIATEMPRIMVTPEEARMRITEEDLLVIVDTFSKDIVEDVELYRAAKHVVVIDHHRQMVNYMENTTLKLHDPHASSAAELVTGMIQYFEWRDQMPRFCAEALLSGIMLDTKNFVMQTGVHTFEVAAFLRERGADPLAVKELFASSIGAYRQRSQLVADAELHGRYAITVARNEVEDIQIIASQAADELLGIEGVVASFVIFPKGELCCVSARSLGQMNVQLVMEALGGGGHQIMAAAQQKGCTPSEMRAKLISALDETENEDTAEQAAAQRSESGGKAGKEK